MHSLNKAYESGWETKRQAQKKNGWYWVGCYIDSENDALYEDKSIGTHTYNLGYVDKRFILLNQSEIEKDREFEYQKLLILSQYELLQGKKCGAFFWSIV